MSNDIALQVATAFFQYWIPFMSLLFAAYLIRHLIFD